MQIRIVVMHQGGNVIGAEISAELRKGPPSFLRRTRSQGGGTWVEELEDEDVIAGRSVRPLERNQKCQRAVNGSLAFVQAQGSPRGRIGLRRWRRIVRVDKIQIEGQRTFKVCFQNILPAADAEKP